MTSIKYLAFLLLIPLFMASGFVSAWIGEQQDNPLKQTDPRVGFDGTAHNNASVDTRKQLEREFDRDMQRRKQQLGALKQRIAKAEEALRNREENRDEIIELRIKTIENEKKGLGWPSKDNSNNPFNRGAPGIGSINHNAGDPFSANNNQAFDPFSAGRSNSNNNAPFNRNTRNDNSNDPFGQNSQTGNQNSTGTTQNNNRNANQGSNLQNDARSRYSRIVSYFGRWKIESLSNNGLEIDDQSEIEINQKSVRIIGQDSQATYSINAIQLGSGSLTIAMGVPGKPFQKTTMTFLGTNKANSLDVTLTIKNVGYAMMTLTRSDNSNVTAGERDQQPNSKGSLNEPLGNIQIQDQPPKKQANSQRHDSVFKEYIGSWGLIINEKDGTNPAGPHELIEISNEKVKIPGMLGTKVFAINAITVDDRTLALQLTELGPKAYTAVMLCKRSKAANMLNINLICTNGEKFEWDVRRVPKAMNSAGEQKDENQQQPVIQFDDYIGSWQLTSRKLTTSSFEDAILYIKITKDAVVLQRKKTSTNCAITSVHMEKGKLRINVDPVGDNTDPFTIVVKRESPTQAYFESDFGTGEQASMMTILDTRTNDNFDPKTETNVNPKNN